MKSSGSLPLLCSVISLLGLYEACNAPGCTVDINLDLGKDSALLLKPSGSLDGFRFFLPSAESGVLHFNQRGRLLLACPGNGNRLIINGRGQLYKEMTAVCVSGKQFKIDRSTADFRNISCQFTPESSVIGRGKCYDDQHQRHSIGFHTSVGFIRLIEVCHNTHLHTTLYTRFNLMTGVDNRQRNVPRHSYFKKGNFFKGVSPSLSTIYSCKDGQYSAFLKLLGRSELAKRYIKCTIRGGESLEKGHLAAYADFVYFPQQKATLYYIDTVPQWQYFNDGNWRILEERIRKYAKYRANDLIIYAGAINVTTLQDKNNKRRKIFLARDSKNNEVLPVPEQLYRIVYDKDLSRATVFLGINSAVRNASVLRQVICRDVCEKTGAFFEGWNRKDFAKGYIYCCSLGDFLTTTGLMSIFHDGSLALL